jgi:ribosomal protein S18 acetylase RimI-like enzyme
MKRALVDAALLEVRHLGADDAALPLDVDPSDEDLADFLRTDARRLQEQGVAGTYLSIYEGKLEGYITILTDAVVLETRERKKLALSSHDHPVVPAIKIARLAVNAAFRATHRGLGSTLVQFARSKALAVLEHAGCRLLTVDAYPESVAFYEALGFARCRAEPYRNRKNVSMWLDVFAGLREAAPGG